jgi:predicted nucleotidyltransferase
MSGFDSEPYASAWKQQNEAEKKRIRERTRKALEEAKRIAARLIEKTGATKVILFGSLAEDNVRDEHFDIDLAIWGGDWFRAREIAEESSFKIDIVEYKNLPHHIKERIDTRGRVLEETK